MEWADAKNEGAKNYLVVGSYDFSDLFFLSV
jgi:hypothetical protein